jgi:hypothetical protein
MARPVVLRATLLSVILEGLTMTGCSPSAPEPGAGLRESELCENLLNTKGHREALSWLRQAKAGDSRNVGEQSESDSVALVEALYRLGAIDVQAVEIDVVKGWGETTNTLVASLPSSPQKRADLFRIGAAAARADGFGPTPDEGQRYLVLYKLKSTFNLPRTASGRKHS